jgi:hypothetical protein
MHLTSMPLVPECDPGSLVSLSDRAVTRPKAVPLILMRVWRAAAQSLLLGLVLAALTPAHVSPDPATKSTPKVQALAAHVPVEYRLPSTTTTTTEPPPPQTTTTAPLPPPKTTAPPALASAPAEGPSYTPPPAPSPERSGVDWDGVAQCESNQRWDINTGNGYEGGLQFLNSTWLNNGGGQYASHAYDATREQQIAVAEVVITKADPWGQWPHCWAYA